MSVHSHLPSTAQWYGSAGFPVFPVHWPEGSGCSCGKQDCHSPAKHPLTQRGFQDASQDPAVIQAWWLKWPMANIGMVTGGPSGLLVVDIDPRNGGDGSLEAVIREHGKLPPTIEQITGGGGRHLFFRYSGGKVPKTLAEGIDLKGDGGYVLVAPSRHASGQSYRWVDGNGPDVSTCLSDIPSWLQDFITQSTRPDSDKSEGTGRAAMCPKGQRNNWLMSLAGTMRSRGMSPEAIEAALIEENRLRCDPPLADQEVHRIAASVARYSGEEPGEWPEPTPLGIGIPPVESFDVELLPHSTRSLVRDLSERLQTPPDFAAAATMVALAGAVGRRALVQPKALDTGWIVTPNLWGGVIARPGFMKSPTIQAIMDPLRKIQAKWFDENRHAQTAYDEELERHALEVAVWKESYKKAAKNGGDKPERPTELTPRPKPNRLIVCDATFEKLHEVMESNPAGVLVLRDELTGWLAQLEKSGRETERAFCLETWNGDGAFTVERVGRGLVHAEHVCMSLFGGIQPGKLRGYLGDALRDGPGDDGLIQRFQVLVWPDLPKDWDLVDRIPDESAERRAAQIFGRLVALSPAEPTIFRFSPDAQELFLEWYSGLQRRVRSSTIHPALASHLSKYSKLMPSLALLFELSDQASSGIWSSTGITLDHTRQAATCCEYLESHAQRLYSCVITAEMRAAAELGEHIQGGELGQDGVFSLRDVYRPQWTGLGTPELASSAIRVLIDCDWVRDLTADPDRRSGRPPSARFVINPKLRK